MTYKNFLAQIGSEEGCARTLLQARWPNGFVCPFCSHTAAYRIASRRLPLYECKQCRKQTSLTAGTVMEKSRTLLSKWLYTMYLLAQSDNGTNAVELMVMLSVTYKTAFHMLRKLRYVMGTPATRPLDDPAQARHLRMSQLVTAIHQSLESKRSAFGKPPADANAKPLISVGLSSQKRSEYGAASLLLLACFEAGAPASEAPEAINHASTIVFKRPLSLSPPSRQSAVQWLRSTYRGLGTAYLTMYLNEFFFRRDAANHGLSAFEQLIRLSVSRCGRHSFARTIAVSA